MSKYEIGNLFKNGYRKVIKNIFLVPCYTIMIPIESLKIYYQSVSHKTYAK